VFWKKWNFFCGVPHIILYPGHMPGGGRPHACPCYMHTTATTCLLPRCFALPCLACAAPLLPPPYLLFLSSTCFRVELMLCAAASPWLPPLLCASSLEFHRRPSFGVVPCLLPLHRPPPPATSARVSTTVDSVPRCLTVRFAGPCWIIERCHEPEPSLSSCHEGPELSTHPRLHPIVRRAASSSSRPHTRLLHESVHAASTYRAPRRHQRVRARAHRCVRPHFEGSASNLGHQDHRVVTLLRCPGPTSAPSGTPSRGPERRTMGPVFFTARAPSHRRPTSSRVYLAPSSASTRATPCSFLTNPPTASTFGPRLCHCSSLLEPHRHEEPDFR
jgi:hypothetical protein